MALSDRADFEFLKCDSPDEEYERIMEEHARCRAEHLPVPEDFTPEQQEFRDFVMQLYRRKLYRRLLQEAQEASNGPE